jgi:glycosyltransferase involved in cell wall biosynthesis
MIEITGIINLHREGLLAHASLRSALAARREAEAAGITVELLAVADSADAATLAVAGAVDRVQVLEASVRDLALARNIGVAAAGGRFIAFLDGDDLWSHNWLRNAHKVATGTARKVVWHPEASLFFGPKLDPYWLIHPDIETVQGDWVTLGMRNHWTSLSFARREVYEQVLFRQNDLRAGFGYEDWSWNAEVIAEGWLHKPVIGTTHLVRVRENSLVRQTATSGALVTPSSLFRRRVGWAARVGAIGVAATAAPEPAIFG